MENLTAKESKNQMKTVAVNWGSIRQD